MGEEDSALETIPNGLSQPRIQDSSVYESELIIGYLAPFLQAWVLQHATDLDTLDGAIQGDQTRPDSDQTTPD